MYWIFGLRADELNILVIADYSISMFLTGEVRGMLIYLKPRYHHHSLTPFKANVMQKSILNNMSKSFDVSLVMCMQFLFWKKNSCHDNYTTNWL